MPLLCALTLLEASKPGKEHSSKGCDADDSCREGRGRGGRNDTLAQRGVQRGTLGPERYPRYLHSPPPHTPTRKQQPPLAAMLVGPRKWAHTATLRPPRPAPPHPTTLHHRQQTSRTRVARSNSARDRKSEPNTEATNASAAGTTRSGRRARRTNNLRKAVKMGAGGGLGDDDGTAPAGVAGTSQPAVRLTHTKPGTRGGDT